MMGGCTVSVAVSSAGLCLRNLDAFGCLVDWTCTRPWLHRLPLQPANTLEESFQLTLGCNLSSTSLLAYTQLPHAARTDGVLLDSIQISTHICGSSANGTVIHDVQIETNAELQFAIVRSSLGKGKRARRTTTRDLCIERICYLSKFTTRRLSGNLRVSSLLQYDHNYGLEP